MATSAPKSDERVRSVAINDDELVVGLMDGRTISTPLAWFPRLLDATPEQRAQWQLCAGGLGIHWPLLDEDLSTQGMLRGVPSRR